MFRTTVRIWIEGVWEQGAEENMSTYEEEVAGDWRRLHNDEAHNL
jgi:hypothetical protein